MTSGQRESGGRSGRVQLQRKVVLLRLLRLLLQAGSSAGCMMAEGGEPPELSPRLKAPSRLYLYFGYRKKTDGCGSEEEGPGQ